MLDGSFNLEQRALCMITREEIDSVASSLTVLPTDVERDYVNGWILAGIFANSTLGKHLLLKGGNALRKGYFSNTRYSKDLDFTAPNGIDREELKAEMMKVTHFVTEHTGVQFLDDKFNIVEPQRAAQTIDVIEVRAYFIDFYGVKCTLPIRVYMDITEYDRVLLPSCDCLLIHPYSDALPQPVVIKCIALEEILASKLKCLLQRRKASDLFDYLRWLIFDDLPVDHSKLLDVFLKKTIYSRAPGAAFDLLTKLPVAVFEELWNRHITAPSTCLFEFAFGIERFQEHLDTLFGERKAWKPFRLSFFPAELRDAIMNAGKEKHLMKLIYDGAERIIEPYALTYKTRREGGGGEYFYAYDRSGGTSGKQSIKTFVAEKVRLLEELDESFEPRYEIEVAQAGDLPDDPYFHGSGRRTFVPAFGITRKTLPSLLSKGQLKHRFRCPICRKRFSRIDNNNNISGHRHPRGYTCGGSSAIYLGYR